jgi:L-ribulose-5-phosphate 3-epimerase
MLSRRQMIAHTAALAAFSPFVSIAALLQTQGQKKYSIGACDWSIGKNSQVEAFDLAKQIGLDGIQINMGSVQNDLHLRNKAVQQSYLEASKRTGVRISGLAIGELNNIPYKSDPRTEEWVLDTIDVAKNLGVSVILLAFFNKNDLRNDDTGKKEVVKRLKKAALKAEKNGVILGIESYLTAAEHLEIIKAVGSRNIKCYYDFRNTADAGHDTVKEFKTLGKKNVCELHMKENGFLLGQGTLDWKNICKAIKDTGFSGWMQIEGAIPKGSEVVQSYQYNLKFLRDLLETNT